MEKSFVTIAQNVCPACGKTFDTGELLIDERLRDRFEHKTVTGFGFCPDDQKKIDDGYRILVAIDWAKSSSMKPEDVYRTGAIAYLKEEVADEMLPDSKGYPMVWVEPEVIDLLNERASN